VTSLVPPRLATDASLPAMYRYASASATRRARVGSKSAAIRGPIVASSSGLPSTTTPCTIFVLPSSRRSSRCVSRTEIGPNRDSSANETFGTQSTMVNSRAGRPAFPVSVAGGWRNGELARGAPRRSDPPHGSKFERTVECHLINSNLPIKPIRRIRDKSTKRAQATRSSQLHSQNSTC